MQDMPGGKNHGKGTMRYPIRNVYDRDYVNNKRQGQGTM